MALVENSESWYHRLEVRGIQYGSGGDVCGVGRLIRVAPWKQEEGPGENRLTTLRDRKPHRIREGDLRADSNGMGLCLPCTTVLYKDKRYWVDGCQILPGDWPRGVQYTCSC